jgi:3-methyladenine DNA glycosylase AlkD
MTTRTRKALKELTTAMEAHRHPAKAADMKRYLLNQFAFLGIQQPLRKQLSRGFINAAKTWEMHEVLQVADGLWEFGEREYQYIALELLYATRRQWDRACLPFFCKLVTRKSWWDTVDFIAPKLIGTSFADTKEPRQMKTWAASPNLWRNRTALLFQLQYKSETDHEFLFSIIRQLQHKKDFFIQKAIGWSLRQYYREDPVAVTRFIAASGISGLAKREALKHEK